jgi:tartrate dehydratase beta subunit/fumarate hydratase class I family protein
MSTGGLFGMGVLVSVIVAVGVALPIYGAILDGRDEAERKLAEVQELSEERPGRRPAA